MQARGRQQLSSWSSAFSTTMPLSQNIQHETLLPASDRSRAIQHANWLIADSGPMDFDMIGERVEGIFAEAVS
jgi:hypothetical protein